MMEVKHNPLDGGSPVPKPPPIVHTTTAKLLAMADKTVGDKNEQLLSRARVMENSSPQPRHTIHLYDMLLAMKEKERLGINFNRSVTLSMESRWEVVNKLTVDFLEEVISLNEQLSEEASKQTKQLLSLIMTRTQRIGMASRIEQMAGLLMHITFYRTVLKAKLGELQENAYFLLTCSDLLGFSHPNQIMDRYEALKFTLTEISDDHEAKTTALNAMHEKLTEMKERAAQENLMMRNRMAQLHIRIKEIQWEISELERHIEEKEHQAADAEIAMKNIKCSINHCYNLFMVYKGQDGHETDPVAQIDVVGIHLSNTLSAMKIVEEQMLRMTFAESSVKGERDSKDTAVSSRLEDIDGLTDTSANYGGGGGGTGRGTGGGAGRRGREVAAQGANKSMNRQTVPEEGDQHGNGLMPRVSDKIEKHKGIYGAQEKATSSQCHVAADGKADKLRELAKRAEPLKQAPRKFPFYSTDTCDWRSRSKSSPVSRSLSIGCDETRRSRGGALHTIDETDGSSKKRLRSTSHDRLSQFQPKLGAKNSSTRCGYKEISLESTSTKSHRASSVPSPASRKTCGSGSLDRSSNRSFLEGARSISQTFASNHRINDGVSLPDITAAADLSDHARRGRCTPTECFCTHGPSAKSRTSLCHLSRMSERVRNQINNVERLYYLSPAFSGTQAADTSSSSLGVWDDGVYLGPGPNAGENRTTSRTKLAKTDKNKKSTMPDPASVENQPLLKVGDQAGDICKALPSNKSPKRLSSPTNNNSIKEADFSQGAVGKKERLRKTRSSQEATEVSTLHTKPLSSDTVNGRAQPKLLKMSTVSSNIDKSVCGKQHPIKENKTRNESGGKCSKVLAKSYIPPLRQQCPLHQRWRFGGPSTAETFLSSSSSSPSPYTTKAHGKAPPAESIAEILARLKRYEPARNLKKDCLAILANVKLGSRWPEDQQP